MTPVPWAAVLAPFDIPDRRDRYTFARDPLAGWKLAPGAQLLDEVEGVCGTVDHLDANHPAHLVACGTLTDHRAAQAVRNRLLRPEMHVCDIAHPARYAAPTAYQPAQGVVVYRGGTVSTVALTPTPPWPDHTHMLIGAPHDGPPENQWVRLTHALADMNAAAGPFTPGDPLDYTELTAEQRAWRTVLHLLAATGKPVTLPATDAPPRYTLHIAAGWRYRVTTVRVPAGITITAAPTRYPEGGSPEVISQWMAAPLHESVPARRSRAAWADSASGGVEELADGVRAALEEL